MRSVAVNVVGLCAYLLFIFVISTRPTPVYIPSMWEIDKLYHAVMYSLLSVLIVRVAVALTEERSTRVLVVGDDGVIRGPRLTDVQLIAVATFLATAFGAAIEVVQSIGVFRHGSPYDAAANFVGAVIGSVVYTRYFRAPRP